MGRKEAGLVTTIINWAKPSVSPGSEKPKPEKPGSMGYNAQQATKDRNATTRVALEEADPEYQGRKK